MLEMNNGMLKMVSGGNYGDSDKDSNPNKSWYNVGQGVELFNTSFHQTTRNRTILDKYFLDGHWVYKVMVNVGPGQQTESGTAWYNASDIER